MSLCNLNQVLGKAQKERYGILATVIFNFDFTEAVLNAAEEKRSPVILMISEPLQRKYSYFNFNMLIGPVRDMAEKSSIPVVLHLDHGYDLDSICGYMDSGLTSVMVSGTPDLDDNIAKTKGVTDEAHKLNITVEGEVGLIEGEGGLEGNAESKITREDIEKSYTDPKEAKRFVEYTGVDSLAVSIGTSHGFFRFKPSINYELISLLENNTKIPLVIHGASGFTADEYKKMIGKGIVKLNYYTGLITAATEEARISLMESENISFTKMNQRSMNAVGEKVKWLMEVFGSSGKG